MKVALVLAVALVICIAIPGSNQGKGKKPKFCTGEDGNRYKRGKGYEDKEACIRYTCVYIKKGNKLKMKETKIQCTEDGAWSSWSSYSACSATCGLATKSRTRTCSDPAPANGGKPCPGLNQETTDCQLSPCGESEPGLAANVTAIEASMHFLNGSVESIANKLEALQSNVESLQTSVESLQTSVESILGMMTTMQSTSSKLEVNITSNMDAISSNKEAISTNSDGINTIETTSKKLEVNITSNMDAISSNNDGINKNRDTCLAIETTVEKLETCLGDVNSTDCPSSEDGKISVVDAIKANKEDIEACEALEKPKFNLALIGGWNGDVYMATSEIMSPGGVCSQSIPPLPEAVSTPQSVYFNNQLMVCGGHKGSQYMNNCDQLRDSNSEWTEGPAMNTPRTYFSMTKVGQDLYALGGKNAEGNLDSMEKISGSSGEWTMMAQKLTSPRREHCTVFMETTRSLVIIGGHPATNLVEEFRLATSSWKELPPLPVGLHGHACAQLGQRIVVTGGTKGGVSGTQKKVYTFAGGHWEMTGQLQEPTYLHSMGTLENKLLVLGGYAGGYLDTIEEMQQDGSFQIIEWKLNEARGYSATAQVPRQMFPCL